MVRLLRVPLVLAFAVACTLGAYALGFLVLTDRADVAVGAAFVGGILTAAALGALTSRAWPILLGIPLAVGAMTTSVYSAAVRPAGTPPPLPGVETAAAVLVPVLVGYVVLLGIVGAVSRLAYQRRFRQHMRG